MNPTCCTSQKTVLALGAVTTCVTSKPMSIRPHVEWRPTTVGIMFVVVVFHWGKIHLFRCWKVLCNYVNCCSSKQIGLSHLKQTAERNRKLLLAIDYSQVMIVYSMSPRAIPIPLLILSNAWIHMFPFLACALHEAATYVNVFSLSTCVGW